jgi:lipopolysaccharide export LptBFGC system permease protein LptF
MILKIQRHLFKRQLLSFCMLLALVVGTYILLDFSMKANDITDSSVQDLIFLAKYYGSEIAKRAYLLVPLCYLLTLLLQFIKLSKSKELVALLSAGISYKKILKPFFVFSFLLSALLFINREYIIPPTRTFLEDFRNDHVRAAKKAKNADEQIFALVLKDDSKLIYQSYDAIKKQYFDLYWIISPSRILRIKYLDVEENGFKARFIDELNRNQLGAFQKKHSFNELLLSKEWLKGAHFDKNLPIQTQKIRKLIASQDDQDLVYSRDEKLTELFLILLSSFSPIWLLMLHAPFLSKYSRTIPVLVIIGGNLLSFFCITTIFDGFGVMTQKSIASPWLLIFIPALIGFLWISYRYRKKLI